MGSRSPFRLHAQLSSLRAHGCIQPMKRIEGQRLSNSFVLRIWWEGKERPIWRGWIQHAATGEARYLECLADLLTFVETHTGSLAQVASLEEGYESKIQR